MAYTYEIRNDVNRKIYIGSTNDYERRKNQHIYELNADWHHNDYL